MDRSQATTQNDSATAHQMLDAAVVFGLTREEAWLTFNDALADALVELDSPEYLDEVAAALARAILAKERRIIRERLQ
jgi:hypothetical protein